jgi:hypothetical protein
VSGGSGRRLAMRLHQCSQQSGLNVRKFFRAQSLSRYLNDFFLRLREDCIGIWDAVILRGDTTSGLWVFGQKHRGSVEPMAHLAHHLVARLSLYSTGWNHRPGRTRRTLRRRSKELLGMIEHVTTSCGALLLRTYLGSDWVLIELGSFFNWKAATANAILGKSVRPASIAGTSLLKRSSVLPGGSVS